MKLKLQKAVILTAFMAFTTMAQEFTPGPAPSGPPDKEKLSYAVGMQMGLEIKPADANVDTEVIAQAIKDVVEGKPTRLKESEIAAVLDKARANGLAVSTQTVDGREGVSYALGMRRGVQLKRAGADVDVVVIGRGIKDVLEGKPTKIQEFEIEPLFLQAQAYGLAQQSQKNKIAGDAFLAKNAKTEGITVLPDGLQYRVLQAGTGEIPTTNDLIIVKYRGSSIEGREFDRNDHFLTRINGGIKGWQETLPRMKVGSKMQIFVPPDLAFGHEGEAVRQIGRDSTLIYELELISIARPGDPLIGTGSLGHGLDGEDSSPRPAK
jgi:FKBP-type peptidyl-prolyl cis-trans isomerase